MNNRSVFEVIFCTSEKESLSSLKVFNFLLVQNLGNFPGKIWTGPLHRGQGETEDTGRDSRLLSGRFHKKGNLHMRLVLGSCKMSRCPHLTSILKVYIEALTGVSHIFSSEGFNNALLSKGCFLEMVPIMGNCGWNIHSKDRGQGEEPLIACIQLWGQPEVTAPQPPTFFQVPKQNIIL